MATYGHEVTRPSATVREIETEDGAVLLDLHHGICFRATTVGTIIWNLLQRACSIDEIVSRISAKYPDVSRHVIAEHVTDFVRSLQAKRLLTSGARLRNPSILAKFLIFYQRQLRDNRLLATRRPRSFLFLKALFGLAAFDLFRMGKNFYASYEFVRAWKIALVRAAPDQLERVSRAVNYACILYPKPVLCLQRSVITTCLLRHCGVPAHMALGAQTFPFKAHAWTEVQGHAVNEYRDPRLRYLIWDRC